MSMGSVVWMLSWDCDGYGKRSVVVVMWFGWVGMIKFVVVVMVVVVILMVLMVVVVW